jgi:DNA mismatch repair protein MutS
MQVGSFYEVYSKTSTDENMVMFSQICDLKIAHKTDDACMAGFRDYMLDKYLSKINESSYTSIIFDQEEINGTIERKEVAIYSPGTMFIDDEKTLSNNITCIWINKTKKDIIFGISNLDIFTGKINICEYQEVYYHNPTTYDNIEKFISIYNPIEIILIYNVEEDIITNIIQYIHFNSKKITKISINNTTELSKQALNCENQNYQNEIIKKFYPNLHQTCIIDHLFEKIISFQSLCFLLNYVSQHNPSLTTLLSEPNIENNETLILANHSLKQLNIIDGEYSGDYSSVLKLINTCKTKIGQREIEHLLLNPITNIEELNKSYNLIEHSLDNNYSWNESLKYIKDIEKIMRKIILCRATPCDFYDIYNSCEILKEIIYAYQKDLIITNYIQSEKALHEIEIIKTFMDDCFNIETIKNVNTLQFDKCIDIIDTLFKTNYNLELDNALQLKLESFDKLNAIIKYLNDTYNLIDKKTVDAVKIHETSSFINLHITKKRRDALNKRILTIPNKLITISFKSSYTNKSDTFVFDLSQVCYIDYNTSTCIIEGSQIKDFANTLNNMSQAFYSKLDVVYKTIFPIFKRFSLNAIIYSIKQLDTLNTKCEIASLYNYSKPTICVNDASYLKIKKLRHALIEHIEKNELYVTNDVELGLKQQGILLFGTNAVGKTSLIKSIGICVILAQAGFYVPCESMEYSPYDYIFTRIIGNDNIFKGLSTFGVEMSELRVILNQANHKSLVLGDELCSGTEIDSALSIFTAGLETLYSKKSSFIFATHFHEIQYFDEITKMTNIRLMHLKVKYNHLLEQLIYDRKLYDGAGESMYGLEVCKSLKMPDEFLKRAYEIRNKYDTNNTNILTLKHTKYNKDKLRGICEFCKKEMGTEMHHMQYQQNSNKREYIEEFHKDHPANLASICETCHRNIHSLGLVYEKKKTFDGYIIMIKQNL